MSHDQPTSPRVRVNATAVLPTRFGDFRVYVFLSEHDHAEHIAIVRGSVWGRSNVPTRLHSECLTGDVLASLRCDCREQLERALATIGQQPFGVLLYLRQEGRGIGLTNKIRAYGLQQELGLDTVDANLALGFPDDARDYGVAVGMLCILGVASVRLMTNNPEKVRQLVAHGMPVAERLAHAVTPGDHNRDYLSTKARRSGHLLEVLEPDHTRAS